MIPRHVSKDKGGGGVMMVKLSDGVTWFESDLDRFDLLYRNHASKSQSVILLNHYLFFYINISVSVKALSGFPAKSYSCEFARYWFLVRDGLENTIKNS